MAAIVHRQASGQGFLQEVSVAGMQTVASGPEENLPGFFEERPDLLAVAELQLLWPVCWGQQETSWHLIAWPVLEAGPEAEGAAGREDSAEDHLR